jgi:hypothetical protein
VEHWRGSGQSAAQYAARRGYSSASLLRWAKIAASRADVTSPPDPPRFVRLEVATARTAALVVEVGPARIVVERGFDVVHLRAVVAALAALAAERAT